jgi:hypothetical protein
LIHRIPPCLQIRRKRRKAEKKNRLPEMGKRLFAYSHDENGVRSMTPHTENLLRKSRAEPPENPGRNGALYGCRNAIAVNCIKCCILHGSAPLSVQI